MKKLLLISVLFLLIAPVFAGPLLNFDDKGLIYSDGKFVPVQGQGNGKLKMKGKYDEFS